MVQGECHYWLCFIKSLPLDGLAATIGSQALIVGNGLRLAQHQMDLPSKIIWQS